MVTTLFIRLKMSITFSDCSPYNKTLIRFKKTEDMFNFIHGYNIAMEGSYT